MKHLFPSLVGLVCLSPSFAQERLSHETIVALVQAKPTKSLLPDTLETSLSPFNVTTNELLTLD